MMKKCLCCQLAVIVICVLPLLGIEEFKKINQWNHGDQEIYKHLSRGIIDGDDHVITRTGGWGARSLLITPKDVVSFAPIGQGPGDIYLLCASCPYQNDLAMVEYSQKLKIFTKKDNKYAWKETKWLKRDRYNQKITDMLFFKDKWFLAGHHPLNINESKKKKTVSLLRIFDKDGKPIKELIIREIDIHERQCEMEHFVVLHDDRLFFLFENELKVYEIPLEKLEVTKEVKLEIPSFYKKMPEDFYMFKRYTNTKDFVKDIQYWMTSYSRIINVLIEDGLLVLQLRTCKEELKKFALLFYDADSLELKKTFFIDDFLLGARKGIYYFYANGRPGLDDDIDECIINLYSFTGKK
ncbi:MAG: hypothetical protein JSV88_10480 [Candidatus Aminicenantes bacterium]|nr:MAG: hypothetical protein JSV88_10480 [Candidatus Aminicenantes bacterium]